jgi:hypothetical protein
MGAHVFEIWYEFNATHEYVVAEIISKPISASLWFIRAQVALQGYFRIPGDITGGLLIDTG